MKVTAANVSTFTRNVPSGIRAVLLHGPDAGLVRDHAATMITGIVGEPADPFCLTVLHPDAIIDGSGSLVDSVNALSFGGGRRVVNLRGAADSSAAACAAVLELGRGDALLIVESSDLTARSKLRALFEKAPNTGTIACFAASAQSINALIDTVFADHGVTAIPQAHETISRHLGADHLVSRRELEKLALYCLSSGRIDADDIRATLPDVAALSIDDVVNALADGDIGLLDRKLRQLFDEKHSGVAIIRAVGRHIQRLWKVQADLASGKSMDAALSGLRPPVFWKYKAAFNRQIHRWSASRLTIASQRLLEAELALKSTGALERPITERCLLSIARLPGRR